MNLLEKLFPPRILYVKIMRNQLVVKDILGGIEIKRNATEPFSNDRLLIAYFEKADNLLRSIIKEITGSATFTKKIHMLIQPVDTHITEITPVEERIYTDFAQFNGATLVKIYPTQQQLSDDEVLEYLTA